MAKRRRRYGAKARKYKITAGSVLEETLPDLSTQTYETLRRKLVVLNEEANKRLEQWSRAGKNLRDELFVTDFQLRLKGKERGDYVAYKVGKGMRKKDLLKEIERVGGILQMKTSTVQGGRELKKLKENLLIMKLSESGIDYHLEQMQAEYQRARIKAGLPSTGETRVPTLQKLGKLMTRLRNDHYISNKAKTGGYSLGSPTVLKTAFNIAFENPGMSVDKLYDLITEELTGIKAKQEKRRQVTAQMLEEVEDGFL